MYWKRYLWSSGKIVLKILLKMLKKHDSLLMQFWCSFEITSKVHHNFWTFLHFSKKNAENPQKTWCTFDAVSMQFWCSFDAVLKLHQKCIKTPWNYIKSASKWCSFKTASKVHHNFWTFLHIFPKLLLKILKKHDALLLQFWWSLIWKLHQ